MSKKSNEYFDATRCHCEPEGRGNPVSHELNDWDSILQFAF